MSTGPGLIILLLATVAAAVEPHIIVSGPPRSIDESLPDGGLPAQPGVANIQVHRAESGWTYNHHVDMACWRGRLYLAWNTCEKDEDVWPSRELYATSDDGIDWSPPRELFPQGVSTALRMYFFLSPSGRMLAIAGLRTSEEQLTERKKGALVVREIFPDHTLGPVHTLRPPTAPKPGLPPPFEGATDAGFVDACRALLANRPFLEQQDYGHLLGDRRMKWHDVGAWPADEPSRGEFDRFGKGTSFFHRKDGALVALMKWGWVIVSHDDGETWSAPTRPASFVSGMAKAWGQRMPNGRYSLTYNPHLLQRFPLVMVTGDDGIRFGAMRVIHGQVPPIRHPGLHKVVGPQSVRGISEWSGDGTRKDDAIWLAYSVGKEDIWVSRVPMDADAEDWNTYSPRLAPVTLGAAGAVILEDRDPADYARAMRLVGGVSKLDVTFDIVVEGASPLMLLHGPRGETAARVTLADGSYRFTADRDRQVYSLWRDGQPEVETAALLVRVDRLESIAFQTGARDAAAAETRSVVSRFDLESE